MQDTVAKYVGGMSGERDRAAISAIVNPIADRLSSQPLATAGLVIKAGGSALAKTGSTAYHATVRGSLVTIAASTDMPALVGSITAGSYNVFCFFIDAASTVTVAMGIESTTRAGVKFPPFPEGKALVGFLIVTYASTFVGGTTALDTATTQYVSPVGPFDPSILLA